MATSKQTRSKRSETRQAGPKFEQGRRFCDLEDALQDCDLQSEKPSDEPKWEMVGNTADLLDAMDDETNYADLSDIPTEKWYSTKEDISDAISEEVYSNLQDDNLDDYEFEWDTKIAEGFVLIVRKKETKPYQVTDDSKSNVELGYGNTSSIRTTKHWQMPSGALGTDGATVMTGRKEGLMGQFLRQNPMVQNCHCSAHRIALCSEQAADGIPGTFIDIIHDAVSHAERKNYYRTRSSYRIYKFSFTERILFDHDLDLLKEPAWLNGKVIYVFLELIKSENMDNIYILPTSIAKNWKENKFQDLREKDHLNMYTWIFMPINVDEEHWILLAADVKNKTVSILDSLNKNNEFHFNQWKIFMRIRHSKVSGLDSRWSKGAFKSNQQMDSHSCGAFVIMNAYAIAKGIPLKDLSQRYASKMREFALAKLLIDSNRSRR